MRAQSFNQEKLKAHDYLATCSPCDMNQRARIKVYPVTPRPNTQLHNMKQSSGTLEREATVKNGNKAVQHRHPTESGNREIATTIQHPPVDVKDSRNNLQESSDCCQSTDAGYLIDAHHYCPREWSPSDYPVTAMEGTRVNKNAISTVNNNDLPAATINYYGQCRDGHAFQVVTPLIKLPADATGSIREAAPLTPTSLGTAKAITDVFGSTDIDTISAETEIKTTGNDSAKEGNKLLSKNTDNRKFGSDAEFYNGTEKSYTISQQKNRQSNAVASETSINSEKYRATTSTVKAEINKYPASEKADIKIRQSSETTISAEDLKNTARTHQSSQPRRRQKKRETAKRIDRRKKQMMTAKETRRLEKRMDSAKQTAERPKKPEERAPNAMTTTPATSIILETVILEVVEIEKSSPRLSGNFNKKST